MFYELGWLASLFGCRNIGIGFFGDFIVNYECDMFHLDKRCILIFFIFLVSCSKATINNKIDRVAKEPNGHVVQIGIFSNALGFSNPKKIKSNIKYSEPISVLVKKYLSDELIYSGYKVKQSDIEISGKIHRIWGKNEITFTIKDTLSNEVLLEKLFISEIKINKLSNRLSHKRNLQVLMDNFLLDQEVSSILASYDTSAITRTMGSSQLVITNQMSSEFFDKKRVALVVGNSNYGVGFLKNPKNDATDIAKELRGLGFSVILKVDANQQQMDAAVVRFGTELSEGGIGLFYYAGHGVQVNGSNYLIPIAASINEEKDVKYKALNLSVVLDEMRDAQTGLNVVIIDACRDNPLPKSSRSSTRGLARIESPSGTIILYATSPGSVAFDGDGRNGLFSKHLLKYMSTPNSSIESVIKQVSRDVKLESNNKQTPWMESSFTGDFYFYETVKAETVKPETVKAETVKPEAVKAETVKPEAVKAETVKPEAVKAEAVKPETVKPEAVKAETVKPDGISTKEKEINL